MSNNGKQPKGLLKAQQVMWKSRKNRDRDMSENGVEVAICERSGEMEQLPLVMVTDGELRK